MSILGCLILVAIVSIQDVISTNRVKKEFEEKEKEKISREISSENTKKENENERK